MRRILEALAIGFLWAICFLIPYAVTLPSDPLPSFAAALSNIGPATAFIFAIGALISFSLPRSGDKRQARHQGGAMPLPPLPRSRKDRA